MNEENSMNSTQHTQEDSMPMVDLSAEQGDHTVQFLIALGVLLVALFYLWWRMRKRRCGCGSCGKAPVCGVKRYMPK